MIENQMSPYEGPNGEYYGGYGGGGGGGGTGVKPPKVQPGTGSKLPPWAAGMDPRFGVWNPQTGGYDFNPGVALQDQDKFPVHDPNYNPWDPTWKYYTQQRGNTYRPLDPSQRNDADWAPTSPITPQGSNINDAWSTSVPWRPEAPTGGLYGAYNSMAAAGPQDLGEAVQQLVGTGAATGLIGGMADPNVQHLANTWIDEYLNPGYSAEAKNAMSQEGMGAARSAADTNANQIMSMARRTNNPMATYGALADVSRGESSALGEQARRNIIDQENAARIDRQQGRQGFSDTINSAYGRMGQGLAALGQSNQQILGRRQQALAGQQHLYDQQAQENDSLLKQLQSLYSTRAEDNTQLGKTEGSGGLWA